MNKLNNILNALFVARPVFSNVATGVHEGGITKMLESAAATRYLLGCPGSSANEVDICGESDLPLGVITDSGEAGEYVNIAMLCAASTTLLMVANGFINSGEPVYAAADGKVQEQPEISGEYYQVGFAITSSSADGDVLEVMPTSPRLTVIINALSGTASVDVSALGEAMEAGPDKVIVLS